MSRFAFALVAVLAIAIAGDAAWAQRGGPSGGGGARPPSAGAPGGGWHGRPPGSGWHGARPGAGWRGGGWYGGWRGGWYGPGVGIYLGGPAYWGGWWPYAYSYTPYSYPYLGNVPTDPPVYIEQNVPPAPTGYWYYCQEPAGYYPYVRECGKAWITVVPQSSTETPIPFVPSE